MGEKMNDCEFYIVDEFGNEKVVNAIPEIQIDANWRLKYILNDIQKLVEEVLRYINADDILIKMPKKLYDSAKEDLPKILSGIDTEITDGDLFIIENKNSFYKNLELEEL